MLRSNQKSVKQRHILFLCDKPYQIFNTLNLVWHARNTERKDIDIFPSDILELCIIRSFNEKECQELSERIRLTNLFQNVWIIPVSPLRKAPTTWLGVLKTKIFNIWYALFPKRLLKFLTDGQDFPDFINRYNVIYLSFICFETTVFIKLNPTADIICFEDGLGNYVARMYGDGIVKSLLQLRHFLSVLRYKLIYNYFGWGIYYLDRIKALYVNNIALCTTPSVENKLPLPKIDKGFLQFANGVFSVDEGYQIQKRFVWLTQPNDRMSEAFFIHRDKTVNVLEHYKDDVLVRMHPRELDKEYYEKYGFEIDASAKLWELIILQQDMEDIVLIAMSSTAQFIPKFLYDKEPILIFTYYMYGLNVKKIDELNTMIDRLRRLYRKPEKIMVVHNFENLIAILKHFHDTFKYKSLFSISK